MNTLQEHKNTSKMMKIIETLADKLKNSSLDAGRIFATGAELDELAGFMEVKHVQAILFAAILSLNFKKRRVSVDHLAGHFGVNGIHIMAHIEELKALQKLRCIRSDMDGESKYAMLSDINFYATRDVLNRMMNRNQNVQQVRTRDIYEILAEIMSLSVDFDRERISHWDLMQDVRELVDTHRELPYFQSLGQEGMFMSDKQVTLTNIASRRYFSEDVDLLLPSTVDSSDIQKCGTISPVRMFFNPEKQEKYCQLGRLLSGKGYREITGRIAERDMRSGFTILLHGAPGTGKTVAGTQGKTRCDALMTGKQPGEEDLRSHCLEEKLNNHERVRVGFRKTA